MLMPKRVKRRKQFRGSMAGKATRGTTITYGDFGLVACDPCWIKSVSYTHLDVYKRQVTILRAVHKYKDSREQFEQRTHKRLIDIITPTQKTVDALSRLEMPAGVYIYIKMKQK